MQPYQAAFYKKHVTDLIKAIDDYLKMEGKLVNNFKVEEHFAKLSEKEVIPFDQFYAILSKWVVSQDKLTFEDFSKIEEEMQREEEIQAFKKMTDRILWLTNYVFQ